MTALSHRAKAEYRLGQAKCLRFDIVATLTCDCVPVIMRFPVKGHWKSSDKRGSPASPFCTQSRGTERGSRLETATSRTTYYRGGDSRKQAGRRSEGGTVLVIRVHWLIMKGMEGSLCLVPVRIS